MGRRLFLVCPICVPRHFRATERDSDIASKLTVSIHIWGGHGGYRTSDLCRVKAALSH